MAIYHYYAEVLGKPTKFTIGGIIEIDGEIKCAEDYYHLKQGITERFNLKCTLENLAMVSLTKL